MSLNIGEYYRDTVSLNEWTQPFSIAFMALRHLFEFIPKDPYAKYCFANGWDEVRYPLITLEVILMGRDVVDEDNL